MKISERKAIINLVNKISDIQAHKKHHVSFEMCILPEITQITVWAMKGGFAVGKDYDLHEDFRLSQTGGKRFKKTMAYLDLLKAGESS